MTLRTIGCTKFYKESHSLPKVSSMPSEQPPASWVFGSYYWLCGRPGNNVLPPLESRFPEFRRSNKKTFLLSILCTASRPLFVNQSCTGTNTVLARVLGIHTWCLAPSNSTSTSDTAGEICSHPLKIGRPLQSPREQGKTKAFTGSRNSSQEERLLAKMLSKRGQFVACISKAAQKLQVQELCDNGENGTGHKEQNLFKEQPAAQSPQNCLRNCPVARLLFTPGLPWEATWGRVNFLEGSGVRAVPC